MKFAKKAYLRPLMLVVMALALLYGAFHLGERSNNAENPTTQDDAFISTDQRLDNGTPSANERSQKILLMTNIVFMTNTVPFADQKTLSNALEENRRLRQQLQELQDMSTNPPAVNGNAYVHQPELRTETNKGSTYDEKLKRRICANNLNQIGIAFGHWALSHQGLTPNFWTDLSNEVSSMVLVCPSSNPSRMSIYWNDAGNPFDVNSATYQLLAPGHPWSSFSVPVVRCPIHNIVLHCNNGAQDDEPGGHLAGKDLKGP